MILQYNSTIFPEAQRSYQQKNVDPLYFDQGTSLYDRQVFSILRSSATYKPYPDPKYC